MNLQLVVQSKLVLEGKLKCLRQQGKGKRPKAVNALTTEEEEMLWSKQSLANCTVQEFFISIWSFPPTTSTSKQLREKLPQLSSHI